MKEGCIKDLLRSWFRLGLRCCRGLGRIPAVRSLERAVSAWLKGKSAVVLGHPMQLDAEDILDLSLHGVYEPLETEFLQNQLSPGDVVLDIGAHIGYYTLLCAGLVGPHGKVFAFEPDPTNFAILTKNVAMNGYGNVVLVPKAVSDHTRAATLYLSGTNSGDHRIYPSENGRRAIEIETIRLDDYFTGSTEPIAFVKIDVQGAEYAALQGMRRVLQENRVSRMLTEFWPPGLIAFGVEPETYLSFLVSEGFRLFDADERQRRIVPAETAELMQKYTGGRRTSTNLLCLKDDARWPRASCRRWRS